jgi:hypothetical protein
MASHAPSVLYEFMMKLSMSNEVCISLNIEFGFQFSLVALKPLRLFGDYIALDGFVSELFLWASEHRGANKMHQIFTEMLDQQPTAYQRALLLQACAIMMDVHPNEDEVLSPSRRVDMALQQLDNMQTNTKEVRSAVLEIMAAITDGKK